MYSVCMCIRNPSFTWLRSNLARTVERAYAAQAQPYSCVSKTFHFSVLPKLPWYARAFVARQSLKSSESPLVISDRSTVTVYFQGNPKIIRTKFRPQGLVSDLQLLNALTNPTQNTLSPLPSNASSLKIPKGRWDTRGLVLPQLCRTCPRLQKHHQLLSSQPCLVLSQTGCGKYLLRKPFPCVLHSMNLLPLFKNTSKPLAWPIFFSCIGRRVNFGPPRSCRTSQGPSEPARLLEEAAEIMKGRKGKQQ